MTVAEASEAEPKSSGIYRYVVLGVLMVVYTLNFLDRQFLSVLAEPVKKSLSLTDTDLGKLTGLYFALFYTVIGIGVGMLADRMNRVWIITAACTVWSAFTGACGFATNFISLAIPRMGVGVGEAGGAPPSYSIIADYFPPRQRGKALGLFSLGVPLGTMFGAMFGGSIAANFGWQTAFKALGVAGLIIAPLFFLIVREPPRGRFDAEPPKQGANPFTALGLFIARPALLLTGLSAGLTAFVGYGMLNWTPALLMRDKGMSLSEVALYYALMSGITGVIGTFMSGALVDWLGHQRPRAYALVPAASMLLSLPFMFLAVNAGSWPVALALFAGPALLNNMYLAPALAVVQNAVQPHQRVTSSAFLLFMLNLIGLGGGPLYVGMVSDHFKPALGGAKALEMGIMWLAPFFVVAALCQLAASHFIAKEAKANG